MNKNTKSHEMSDFKLSKITEHIKNNYISNNRNFPPLKKYQI